MYYMSISKERDVEQVQQFTNKAGLEAEAADIQAGKFVLLKDEKGDLLGLIGLEMCGEYGLLRSFAFLPESQAQVPALFETILAIAKESGAKQVFLASNKFQAVSFFEALQFEKWGIKQLPDRLLKSPLVEKVCTMNEVYFMSRRII